ncbi:CBS domain-containing protein [bacterium CPR1]|nr:CBS domain-containing protein [bacterium CPR1]
MSLFVLVDGVLYRSRPVPDNAGRTWEPAFPQEFDQLSMPPTPPAKQTASPTPPPPPPPPPSGKAPPQQLATPVPAGLIELWQLAVPPPRAPPSGNSEIVAVAPFRPRGTMPRIPFHPPEPGQVEPVDPDSRRAWGSPEKPVLVESVMTCPVDCITSQASQHEAQQALENGHYHHLPVVDEQHRLVGILSDRDLLAAAPGDPLSSMMTTPVLVASPYTPLSLACEGLWVQKVSCLPVVDGNFRPLGILTVQDVLRYLVRHPLRLYSVE